MRRCLRFLAALWLGFIPASVLVGQHHGGHFVGGLVHPGVVHPGLLQPGFAHFGSGYSPGGAASSVVNATQVNVNTFTTVNNLGGPWAYGPGGGYYVVGYRPFGYGLFGAGAVMLPPAVAPAGALFGPQAIAQLLNGVAAANAAPQQGPAVPAAPQKKVRVSNAEAKARAGKLIDAGDKLFAAQRYREALERYKSAVVQAPDLAEIFLRQGFAHVAMGQYESAAKIIRRGLKLKPDWRPDELRLDKLYGAEKLAQGAHLEALATVLQSAPHDATALCLLGMELYFEGQVERSGPFFVRASQLGANEDHLLDGFLTAAANAAAPPAGAAAAPPAGAAAPGLPGKAAIGDGQGAPPAAAKPADRGPILDL